MSDGLDGMGFMALRRRCAELGATPSQVDALMGKPAALALATRLTHQRQLADAEKADKAATDFAATVVATAASAKVETEAEAEALAEAAEQKLKRKSLRRAARKSARVLACVERCLSVFDLDGSGTLSKADFTAMLTARGDKPLTPAAFDNVWAGIDADGEGKLSAENLSSNVAVAVETAQKLTATATAAAANDGSDAAAGAGTAVAQASDPRPDLAESGTGGSSTWSVARQHHRTEQLPAAPVLLVDSETACPQDEEGGSSSPNSVWLVQWRHPAASTRLPQEDTEPPPCSPPPPSSSSRRPPPVQIDTDSSSVVSNRLIPFSSVREAYSRAEAGDCIMLGRGVHVLSSLSSKRAMRVDKEGVSIVGDPNLTPEDIVVEGCFLITTSAMATSQPPQHVQQQQQQHGAPFTADHPPHREGCEEEEEEGGRVVAVNDGDDSYRSGADLDSYRSGALLSLVSQHSVVLSNFTIHQPLQPSASPPAPPQPRPSGRGGEEDEDDEEAGEEGEEGAGHLGGSSNHTGGNNAVRAASFDHAFFAPAAVHVTGQCRAAVVGCSISNAAGWGVDVSGEGTCPLFDGNTIHSSALGGIHVRAGAGPVFKGNVVWANGGEAGCAVRGGGCTPVFVDNEICYNEGAGLAFGAGGGLGCAQGCNSHHNGGAGISLQGPACDPTLEGNEVCMNAGGGLLLRGGCCGVLLNNSVHGNSVNESSRLRANLTVNGPDDDQLNPHNGGCLSSSSVANHSGCYLIDPNILVQAGCRPQQSGNSINPPSHPALSHCGDGAYDGAGEEQRGGLSAPPSPSKASAGRNKKMMMMMEEQQQDQQQEQQQEQEEGPQSWDPPPDPSSLNANADQALLSAAASNDSDLVQTLLLAGANPNAASSGARSVLHVACSSAPALPPSPRRAGDGKDDSSAKQSVIQLLLLAGADAFHRDLSGATPLHAAAAYGCSSAVDELLSSSGGAVRGGAAAETTTSTTSGPHTGGNSTQPQGTGRVGEQHTAGSVSLLLELEMYDGSTPLHLACWNGHAALAGCLLAAGANALAITSSNGEGDGGGSTALHMACWNGHDEVAKLLVHCAEEANPGFGAAALIRAADSNGRTALHHCSQQGHYETVLVIVALFDAKAPGLSGGGRSGRSHGGCSQSSAAGRGPPIVNACDVHGSTPLMLAVAGASAGAVNCIKLLHMLGADLNAVNSSNTSALGLCAHSDPVVKSSTMSSVFTILHCLGAKGGAPLFL